MQELAGSPFPFHSQPLPPTSAPMQPVPWPSRGWGAGFQATGVVGWGGRRGRASAAERPSSATRLQRRLLVELPQPLVWRVLSLCLAP